MFERNELVLAWHGPLLYDAIIKDVKQDSSCDSYLVHYQGWNNRWDEWVSGERMLKRNTTNLREQERASAAVDQARKQAKQGKKLAKPTNKRKLDDAVETEETTSMKLEIALAIPGALQRLMIQDWERINKLSQLVPLPRSPTVDAILDDFLKSKTRKPQEQKLVEEVVNGLRVFFDRALPTRLLYESERPQYDEMIVNEKLAMSSVYGLEHLLRLFVILPSLMAYTDIDKERKLVLVYKFSELLKFLVKKPEWFADEYTPMSPIYLDKLKELKENSSKIAV